MSKRGLWLAVIGAMTVSALHGQTAVDPEKGFVLQNGLAQYQFEPRGFGLSAMIDKKTGFNHIRPIKGKHLLWEVAFGRGTMRPRIDNNYKPCAYAELWTRPNGDQILVLQWNRLR